MPCILRFSAQNFDIEELIACLDANGLNLELDDECVHKQGTLTQSGKRIWNSSGFRIVAGEGDFHQFEEQIADTILFLKYYLKDLQLLGRRSRELDNSSFYLDFGIWTKMFNQVTQSNMFPIELIQLAGTIGIGIKLSQYPDPSDAEEEDDD